MTRSSAKNIIESFTGITDLETFGKDAANWKNLSSKQRVRAIEDLALGELQLGGTLFVADDIARGFLVGVGKAAARDIGQHLPSSFLKRGAELLQKKIRPSKAIPDTLDDLLKKEVTVSRFELTNRSFTEYFGEQIYFTIRSLLTPKAAPAKTLDLRQFIQGTKLSREGINEGQAFNENLVSIDFVRFFLENPDASEAEFQEAYHQSMFKQQYQTPYRKNVELNRSKGENDKADMYLETQRDMYKDSSATTYYSTGSGAREKALSAVKYLKSLKERGFLNSAEDYKMMRLRFGQASRYLNLQQEILFESVELNLEQVSTIDSLYARSIEEIESDEKALF